MKNIFQKKFEKKFEKKILNLFFEIKLFQKIEEIFYVEDIFYFARFLEIITPKMKSSKIDQWQLGCDHFCQIQRPITRVCFTQMKNFIRLNGSSHQDL